MWAVGVRTSQRGLVQQACDVMNQAAPAIGAEWTDDARQLCWQGKEIPQPAALGAAAYAIVLSLQGIRISAWVRKMGLSKAPVPTRPASAR